MTARAHLDAALEAARIADARVSDHRRLSRLARYFGTQEDADAAARLYHAAKDAADGAWRACDAIADEMAAAGEPDPRNVP